MIIIITMVIIIIYEIIDIMQLIRGDNYQSWVYSSESDLVAVDPWLTRKQVFPILGWLLYRDSEKSSYLEQHDQIDAVTHIIITAHFSDHLDLESLKKFKADIPIFTTEEAAKVLIKNQFTNTVVVKPQHKYQLGSFELEVYKAGSPYHSTTFAYTLRDAASIIFHEPHMVNSNLSFKNLNACILTVDQVKVLGFIKVSMGIEQAKKMQRKLNAEYLLATGIAPNKTKGLITYLLSIKENYSALNGVNSACSETGDSLML